MRADAADTVRALKARGLPDEVLSGDLESPVWLAAQAVGISAGCALLGRVAVGEAYQLSEGAWRRRDAGEPAPRPNYCG